MSKQKVNQPDFTNKEETAKALLALYSRQTYDERMSEQTIENNSIGFNGPDAEFLSSVALWIQEGKPYSDGQHKYVAQKLPKYWRQFEQLNWKSVTLPEVARTTKNNPKPNAAGSPKPNYDGILNYRKDNEGEWLHFAPFTYPSKQVKDVWPCRWVKTTQIEHTTGFWRGMFYPEAVTRIKEMFPTVKIMPAVEDALSKDAGVYPTIQNHDKAMDFQKAGATFLVDSKRGLLALEQGLGKTLTASLANQVLKGNPQKYVLVIAPTTLMYNWVAELKMWFGIKAEVWHRGLGKMPESQIIITNYETALRKMVKFDLKEVGKKKIRTNWRRGDEMFRPNVLIVDETVMLTNRKAQRTLAIKALAKEAEYVWFLSGSPTRKNLSDLWAQFNILWPKRFSSFWKFAGKYCVIEQNQWGAKIVGNQHGAVDRLQKDQADIFFHRTQDDVLDLPEYLFETIDIPMGSEQTRLYLQMQKDFIADLPDGNDILAPNHLAQMLRLSQLASNGGYFADVVKEDEGLDDSWKDLIELFQAVEKADPAQALNLAAKWQAVLDLLDFKEFPMIIWTNFIKTADSMAKILRHKGYTVEVITGATKVEDRVGHEDAIVDRFQAGKVDILIAHPGAAKFGLTLTKGRTAIYLERSYNSDDYNQSLYRIRRIGTEHRPNIVILRSVTGDGRPTIDHVIHEVLERRHSQNRALIADDIKNILGETNG